MKKVFLAMAAVAMLFVGCKKDKDNTTDNLAEKIIGKWITADKNGQPLPTNKKNVKTFVSATKAYLSTSFTARPEIGELWVNQIEGDVAISGNKVTLISNPEENETVVEEYTITDITVTEFIANYKITVSIDGKVVNNEEMVLRFTKLARDYKQAVLGKWQGHVTSEMGSEFDDGEDHQWEYLSDGTFRYYLLDDDSNWVTNPNQTLSQYFVDGTLLCTRWVIDGTVNREWWEIASIENDVMNWTALRQREDGTTYTATFSMTKVN
jgi:6-pyruvoyl-tetrahydropterin synthase